MQISYVDFTTIDKLLICLKVGFINNNYCLEQIYKPLTTIYNKGKNYYFKCTEKHIIFYHLSLPFIGRLTRGSILNEASEREERALEH